MATTIQQQSPLVTKAEAKQTPSTPSRSAASAYRLLYRGALSLPDSHLTLDGLSFVTTTTGAPGSGANAFASPSVHSLLENPLALALESMRGRNLHFVGMEKVSNVYLDTRGDIGVFIHPLATLTKIYLENVLCLETITSSEGRTSYGIRVSLSDNNDPSTTDILIYGQLLSSPSQAPSLSLPSTSVADVQTLHIFAARILAAPPPLPSISRAPRPDDPTPRKPPTHLAFGLGAKRKREITGLPLDLGQGTSIKRTKSGKVLVEEDEKLKHAREVMLKMPKGSVTAENFKVPQLPPRSLSMSSTGGDDSFGDRDVFGAVASVVASAKSKERNSQDVGSVELEKANKMVIKQATVTCLGKHDLKKGHPDFNEVFQAVYRGVTFSLRNVMRTQAANIRTVERLLEAHARMYINGNGDNHISGSTEKNQK